MPIPIAIKATQPVAEFSKLYLAYLRLHTCTLFIAKALVLFLLTYLSSSLFQTRLLAQDGAANGFSVEETTIADIHQAFRNGELSAVSLVDIYLRRIAEFDQPKDLKAFVVLNARARKRAQELDLEFAKTGKLRPLHGIPVAVKDNYDTHDLQTAAGSMALAGSLPPDDSSMVKRIRAAGGIVLGKTNMDEWAFSPLKTESSILGTTRNPYDLRRVPAGSSQFRYTAGCGSSSRYNDRSFWQEWLDIRLVAMVQGSRTA